MFWWFECYEKECFRIISRIALHYSLLITHFLFNFSDRRYFSLGRNVLRSRNGTQFSLILGLAVQDLRVFVFEEMAFLEVDFRDATEIILGSEMTTSSSIWLGLPIAFKSLCDLSCPERYKLTKTCFFCWRNKLDLFTRAESISHPSFVKRSELAWMRIVWASDKL